MENLEAYVRELPRTGDWLISEVSTCYAAKHPPKKISDHVYRPYNVNRTHAFMVRGRATMKALYRHLNWNDWHVKHHIDHHLGRLTQRRYEALVQGKNVEKESIPVYTPDRWLVVSFQQVQHLRSQVDQTRFFNDAKNADHSDAPFFAVLGPHRSGTSCVAMVMHHLGVHMGNELGGYEATGGGEAIGLAQLCEKAMRFPATDPKTADGQLSKQLKAWIVARKAEAIRDRTVAGGKYPHLCRLQTTSTKPWVTRCESSQSIAQSKPQFDPFKIEVADIQANGSQPAMMPATNSSVRFWNIAKGLSKNIPKFPSIGSTSPS